MNVSTYEDQLPKYTIWHWFLSNFYNHTRNCNFNAKPCAKLCSNMSAILYQSPLQSTPYPSTTSKLGCYHVILYQFFFSHCTSIHWFLNFKNLYHKMHIEFWIETSILQTGLSKVHHYIEKINETISTCTKWGNLHKNSTLSWCIKYIKLGISLITIGF